MNTPLITVTINPRFSDSPEHIFEIYRFFEGTEDEHLLVTVQISTFGEEYDVAEVHSIQEALDEINSYLFYNEIEI